MSEHDLEKGGAMLSTAEAVPMAAAVGEEASPLTSLDGAAMSAAETVVKKTCSERFAALKGSFGGVNTIAAFFTALKKELPALLDVRQYNRPANRKVYFYIVNCALSCVRSCDFISDVCRMIPSLGILMGCHAMSCTFMLDG
jgi:hypothetical protein